MTDAAAELWQKTHPELDERHGHRTETYMEVGVCVLSKMTHTQGVFTSHPSLSFVLMWY